MVKVTLRDVTSSKELHLSSAEEAEKLRQEWKDSCEAQGFRVDPLAGNLFLGSLLQCWEARIASPYFHDTVRVSSFSIEEE